jgi:D-sedoheptulose 7-phosphate isomerase
VAVDDMGIVESLHTVVFHWVIDDLNRRFAGSGKPATVS